MPSNVLVSGAGSSEANGTYTYRGEYNGKPFYNLVDQEDDTGMNAVAWNGAFWMIRHPNGDSWYYTAEDVEFPWLVTTWLIGDHGIEPLPTVTEIPVSSQNTFGLPADVVALITSRFGTVANFLRLRNQGQV
jgi:hypothetical protein